MSDRRNEAVYRAITSKSPRTERAATWQDGMRLVVSLAGGNVSAAARALDVPRRTLRRWLAGEGVPPAERRAQVSRLALQVVRRDRLAVPRERRLIRAKHIIVTARYRYDWAAYGAEAREIPFRIDGEGTSTSITPDVMGRVLARYLGGATASDDTAQGHTRGLFAPIAESMQDEWYREHMMSDHRDEGFDIFSVRFK